MDTPIIETFDVDGTQSSIEPPRTGGVQAGNTALVKSGAVFSRYSQAENSLDSRTQNVQLEQPVNISGVEYATVEEAIKALAANTLDVPKANDSRFFTSGGAYADKTNTPESGNIQNLTAGGAYSDKTDVTAQDDMRNFTAGGAYADKTEEVTENDTRCVTATGAHLDKVNYPEENSTKNFSTVGMQRYTARNLTWRSWLGKVFGQKIGKEWHNATTSDMPQFVDIVNAKNSWVGATRDAVYYSEDGVAWTNVLTIGSASTETRVTYFADAPYHWIVQFSAYTYASEDGVNWTQLALLYTSPSYTLTYFKNLWISIPDEGRHVKWSSDLVAWTNCTIEGAESTDTHEYSSTSQSNTTLVLAELAPDSAGVGLKRLTYTDDGKDWHVATLNTANANYIGFLCTYYANYRFIAVESSSSLTNRVWYSSNGKEWTLCTATYTDKTIPSTRCILYANGRWLLGTRGDGILMSYNLSSWSKVYTQAIQSDEIETLGYVNGMYLAAVRDKGIWWSIDGRNWTQSDLTSSSFRAVSKFFGATGRIMIHPSRSGQFSNVSMVYSDVADVIDTI